MLYLHIFIWKMHMYANHAHIGMLNLLYLDFRWNYTLFSQTIFYLELDVPQILSDTIFPEWPFLYRNAMWVDYWHSRVHVVKDPQSPVH